MLKVVLNAAKAAALGVVALKAAKWTDEALERAKQRVREAKG
jgi:hypothetical protein